MKIKFLVLFYSMSALVLIVSIFGLFSSYKKFRFFLNLLTNSMLMSLKLTSKITVEVINHNKYDVKDGYLYASKHQSIFETIYFNSLFYNPAYILKKELLNIPLFGIYLKKLEMIAIDRSKGIKSIKYVNEETKRLSKFRPVIIFPEGTRTEHKDQPDLKSGIYSIYKNLDKPVIPIATNSGKYWPKNNQMRSGKIIIEFKEPIQPGLSKEDFLKKLKFEINSLNH